MKLNERQRYFDLTLTALAHPVRRAILERVMKTEVRITELAKPHAMSLDGGVEAHPHSGASRPRESPSGLARTPRVIQPRAARARCGVDRKDACFLVGTA